jgi:hypothetical protein
MITDCNEGDVYKCLCEMSDSVEKELKEREAEDSESQEQEKKEVQTPQVFNVILDKYES